MCKARAQDVSMRDAVLTRCLVVFHPAHMSQYGFAAAFAATSAASDAASRYKSGDYMIGREL